MTKMMLAIAAGAITLLSPSLAQAGHHSAGGESSSGASSVPEPTDAVLLLMGAGGVILGRHLHARKNRKPD